MKKYVTFNEVIEALVAGKEVSFYNNEHQVTFDKNRYIEQLGLDCYTLDDIINGTWVIEN